MWHVTLHNCSYLHWLYVNVNCNELADTPAECASVSAAAGQEHTALPYYVALQIGKTVKQIFYIFLYINYMTWQAFTLNGPKLMNLFENHFAVGKLHSFRVPCVIFFPWDAENGYKEKKKLNESSENMSTVLEVG